VSGVDELEQRLAELQAERAEIASTRTREDVRVLAESWLSAALARTNGAARGYVLNGHVGPTEVQAVLSEYLLESGALVDFIIAKVEAEVELTNRDRSARVKKLDAACAAAEQEVREAARAAALAEVERQFAGEAA
jgi:hypothetical protein